MVQKKSHKSISVIIPAYNEEKRILPTIKDIKKYIDNNFFDWEIIVVNDASTDNTVLIVKKQGIAKVISAKKNLGKGGAFKLGVKNARKSMILLSDADHSTPISELSRMMPFLQDFDILIGSRNLKESKIVVKQPVFRQLLGKTFPLIVRLLLLPGIKDTQCGFKLFKGKCIKDIVKKQKIDGFAFDVELLYLAKKKGYKIKEIGVTWRNDKSSKINPIKDSLKMLKEVIKIKMG